MIDNPIGIDAPIQELQELFIDELWTDIAADKKQFNHRVFRNLDRNGNLIPEIIVSGSNEYEEVKFNDSLTALSWFDVSDTPTSFDGGQSTREVGIFFAVNLTEIYPNLDHRAVEEVHRDVLELLDSSNVQGDAITGEAAYGDFSVDNLKRYNMQPWHVFRIPYLMQYTIDC